MVCFYYRVRVKKLVGELSAKPFCFIQTKDGKIPIVLHDSGENPEVLNFKKAIVSGFQANFNSALSDVNELDPESEHTSHYELVDSSYRCVYESVRNSKNFKYFVFICNEVRSHKPGGKAPCNWRSFKIRICSTCFLVKDKHIHLWLNIPSCCL